MHPFRRARFAPVRPLLLAACAALGATAAPAATVPPPDEPEIASYELDIEAKILSDRRNRGISDTFNSAGAELNFSFAHQSGFVAVADFGTVSKIQFPDGSGTTALLAAGYRFGNPDGWHFGLGLAQELFPGAKVDAPTGLAPVFDPVTGEVIDLQPTGMRTTRFDTTYAVLEFGYQLLEGRYLNVLSEDYRGGNTSTICPLYLPDAAAALACYARGDFHTRGTQMIDLDMAYPVAPHVKLLGHLGYETVPHFSGYDFLDWRAGASYDFGHGVTLSAEGVGTNTSSHQLFLATSPGGSTAATDKTTVVVALSKKW
jgi:hypothetical protein